MFEIPLTRPRISVIACIAIALIAADMLLGLRAGSNFGGDARYHAARIRGLVDLGFNNWDPLVPGPRFDDVYHTNLYHALIAASANLTGIDPAMAWACAGLGEARVRGRELLPGVGDLGRALDSMGQRRRVRAVDGLELDPGVPEHARARTGCCRWHGRLGVELLAGTRTRAAVAGMAACAWVLPQVHALYYVFVCMLLGPAFVAGWWIARARGLDASRAARGVAVLALGAPWLGVTLWQRAHPAPAVAPAPGHPGPSDAAAGCRRVQGKPTPSVVAARSRGFIRLSNGMLMLDPGPSADRKASNCNCCVLLAVAIAAKKRRAQCLAVLRASC